nr:hypothetical protein [uncultured Blautia sp.]
MWWSKKKKDKDKIIKEIIEGGKTRGFIFPPYVEDVYSISEWKASFTDGESRPYCRELQIVLEPSDWYKFQSQPFYQELIQYLDNVKIQKRGTSLDEEQNSQEEKE